MDAKFFQKKSICLGLFSLFWVVLPSLNQAGTSDLEHRNKRQKLTSSVHEHERGFDFLQLLMRRELFGNGLEFMNEWRKARRLKIEDLSLGEGRPVFRG